MLPASILGPGMNMGFPDVCLTPAGPAVVPIPYPNMAMHAMAVPTCPTILNMMMPALNQATIIPMTLGDQPGVASPFMGPGLVTMGVPTILLQGMPAVTMASITAGNNMINPIGAVTVPGAPTILYCYAAPAEAVAPALLAGGSVESSLARDGVGRIRIAVFSSAVPGAVHCAIEDLRRRGTERLVFDVRGNPGGEALAAIELLRDLLARGAVIATLEDGDGDGVEYRARGDSYPLPIAVLVDAATASAAEIFAGALQAHRRAIVVGETTYGKSAARTVVGGAFVEAGRFLLPGGVDVGGVGVSPDAAELPPAWRPGRESRA
jgi:carboxyl-terminal processing protease